MITAHPLLCGAWKHKMGMGRMGWVLKDHLIPPRCHGHTASHHTGLLKAPSSLVPRPGVHQEGLLSTGPDPAADPSPPKQGVPQLGTQSAWLWGLRLRCCSRDVD